VSVPPRQDPGDTESDRRRRSRQFH
jgi:hypothetical protein